MSPTSVRPAQASDEAALAALAERVVDGGAVAFTTRHRVPLLEAAGAHSVGFVAESAGEVIGAGWVRVGRCRLLGSPQPYAMLHSLAVAPEFRGRGVARALTDARLAWTAEESARRDETIVAMATIQQGNTASLANARRWATAFTGELRVTPVPVRSRPPRERPGWLVRTATDPLPFDDVPGIGPDTAPEAIREWLARSVRGEPVNHLHVLTDRSGSVSAAIGIHDDTPVSELQVVRMPGAVALANRLVRVVGPGGAMRTGQVALAWHRDAAAGRYLWQYLRWHWRSRLTSLVTTVDPSDPLAAMTRAPRWLPATRIRLAVRLPDGSGELAGPIRLPL